jgi:sugar phosphate isomerase/epimerase
VRLSCVPATWFLDIVAGRMSIEAWIAFAASLGLDGLDFGQAWFRDRLPPAIAALRRRVEDAGLRPCLLRCAPDFTHPDPARRRAELDEMRAMVDLARALGGAMLRFVAGQAHPGVSRAEGVTWVCEGLRVLLPHAEAAGITVAYENHTKASVWQYRDFSEDSAIFLEIVRATEGTGLRVNFDTGNPLVHDEDPLPLLERVAHRVACVDANDSRTHGKFEFCVVGQGLVPFPRIFGFLKRTAGYDGWISVEEFSHTGEQGFRDAVRFVREAWAAA